MERKTVTDGPGVTDTQGPTLDDIADVLARTNRGLLRLERLLNDLAAAFFTFVGLWFMVLLLKARG